MKMEISSTISVIRLILKLTQGFENANIPNDTTDLPGQAGLLIIE